MKLRDWHERELARDPEYARASAAIDFVQTVADIIVDARIRAGLTQADLAERAGVTQPKISQLEHGDGNPTMATITAVIEALRQSVQVDFSFNVAPDAPSNLLDVYGLETNILTHAFDGWTNVTDRMTSADDYAGTRATTTLTQADLEKALAAALTDLALAA